MVETLEDRTLLSGNPLIDGDYTISGLTATIDQAGDDLTLTNESGSVSIGDFLSPSQIIANDWEGGLIGNLYNGWIEWANGTIWFDDPPLAPDTTDYSVNINPGVANTLRDGDAIAFTNELGDVSPGSYLSSTQVIADGWEGGLVGDLVGDSIEWTNGTIWTITIGAGLNDEGAGDPGDPGGGDPGTGEPTFDPDWYTFNTPEDAAVGTTVGTVSYSDPEGQTVTLTLDDGAGGSVPFAIDATGTITVNGPLDYETQDLHTITVTATDPDGNSGFANVDVIVDDVDESPEFDPDYYTFNISEDAITGTPVGSVSYSDPQGHSVTLTIDDGFGGAVPFAIDDIGEITVDGPLDFETQDFYALTVTGTDPDGNIGTAAVDVWIDDVVTEAPIFDPDSYAYGIDEDSAVGTLVGSVTVIEPDGQTYTLTLDDPLGGSVPFAIDTAGDITISTALDYDTQEFYELIATATDSEGNSSTAPVEIYVYESTIPVAFDTTRSTRHDEPLSDSVTYDAIDEDGDPLTFHLDANPTNGNVTFNADGTFTYTPNGSFAGSDSFTWHASDGDNDSNIATLTIDVFNFAPQTYDGWHTTFIDTALNGDLADNAYEQDGDPLTFAEDTAPANGTVTIDPSGTWTYTPNLGFSGEDSFTFTATDGIDTSTVATIHIDVVADYNAGPLVANEDIAITERDTPVVIDVLTNDGSSSGGLNVVAVSTTPAHGTVVINPDNTITYTPNDPLYTGPDSFIYDVQDASSTVTSATVDVYVIRIDLDVNNDGDLDDAVDGVENYLPGYVGEDDVLSTGDSLATVQYLGQELQLIIEGLGTDAGVQQIEFELFDFTTYEGYSENTSDVTIEGSDKDNDFSFDSVIDDNLFVLLPGMTLAADKGEMEVNRGIVKLTAKDYGAKTTVRITVRGTWAIPVKVFEVELPQDSDKDNLSDGWEYIHRLDWNSQYGTSETGFGLFSAKPLELIDTELPDADAMSNTDGGRNLPAHQRAGDRLFVFQEYRGFVLDGGGFEGDGSNGHSGGHKRLSPVHKELLVEVDSMVFKDGATPGIVHGSNSLIDTALATASKGFSNKDKGSGILMYWVRSEKDLKYKEFATDKLLLKEMAARRTNPTSPKLKRDFVHLMFFGKSPASVTVESGAWTNDYTLKKDEHGSMLFLDRIYSVYTAEKPDDYPFAATVSGLIAHELTHLLLFPTTTPSVDAGWKSNEHLLPLSGVESGYLMNDNSRPENTTAIWFSDKTIGEINVSKKHGTNP